MAVPRISADLAGTITDHRTPPDPDAAIEELIPRLYRETGAHMRRACPAKGCYEEQGHDGNVHGMRMPTMTNRSQRRGQGQAAGRRGNRRR